MHGGANKFHPGADKCSLVRHLPTILVADLADKGARFVQREEPAVPVVRPLDGKPVLSRDGLAAQVSYADTHFVAIGEGDNDVLPCNSAELREGVVNVIRVFQNIEGGDDVNGLVLKWEPPTEIGDHLSLRVYVHADVTRLVPFERQCLLEISCPAADV